MAATATVSDDVGKWRREAQQMFQVGFIMSLSTEEPLGSILYM